MANAVTGIRLVCALSLIFSPTFSMLFYVIYFLGGISDVLDGIIARHFGKATKFGSGFDTVADIFFTVIVIIKVFGVICIPMWAIIWIVCIAVIKTINIISGFVIYKRFVPEHTVMNKICGALIFAVPVFIGSFPSISAVFLITPICFIATFSAIQEGYFIFKGKEIN